MRETDFAGVIVIATRILPSRIKKNKFYRDIATSKNRRRRMRRYHRDVKISIASKGYTCIWYILYYKWFTNHTVIYNYIHVQLIYILIKRVYNIIIISTVNFQSLLYRVKTYASFNHAWLHISTNLANVLNPIYSRVFKQTRKNLTRTTFSYNTHQRLTSLKQSNAHYHFYCVHK